MELAELLKWAIWTLLLVLQNASNTVTMRARASGSPWYTWKVSWLSNGVWFASYAIILDFMMMLREGGVGWKWAALGVFYTFWTSVGSASAHWASMRYLETAKTRRVGSYIPHERER